MRLQGDGAPLISPAHSPSVKQKPSHTKWLNTFAVTKDEVSVIGAGNKASADTVRLIFELVAVIRCLQEQVTRAMHGKDISSRGWRERSC